MLLTLSSAFIYSVLIQAQAASDVLYTLKDLEVLEREKNFEEFLKHVNDIRPSERQKLWKDMYQSMAMEMINYKLKTRDFSLKAYKEVENLGRTSAMGNDEFFQLKRSLYAKKFFSECYQVASKQQENSLDYKTCDNELNSFWYFSKKDADVGLYFASLVEKYPSTLKTWPFYQRAINDKVAPIYCSQRSVQNAIIGKLTQESFKSDFDGNYKNLINRFVPEECFLKLVAPLRISLTSPKTSGLIKELALNILEAKDKLTKDEEELYAITYLLDGPVVGDKMNIAWKKVELFGENYEKRKKILNELKKLDFLPDKIFKDPLLPRHKAIINLFAKNFPEFLNYYGESCLSYLENKSDSASNITSTYQCHEFLKAATTAKLNKESEWVNDTITIKYSSLKK